MPVGARGALDTEPSTSSDTSTFHLAGDYWTISYDGHAIRLRDARGLRYLAQLLWHPGREFHANELVQLAIGGRSLPTRAGGVDGNARELGDAGEMIDDQARREYRRHLAALRQQLEEAEERHDAQRAERIRDEIDAIARSLSATARGRRVASHAERARLTVTKGIKAALGKILASHPALARHLKATVRRGYTCVYQPDPRHPITWAR